MYGELTMYVYLPSFTPLKFKIAPENRPSQKDSSFPTTIFQGRAVKLPWRTIKINHSYTYIYRSSHGSGRYFFPQKPATLIRISRLKASTPQIGQSSKGLTINHERCEGKTDRSVWDGLPVEHFYCVIFKNQTGG